PRSARRMGERARQPRAGRRGRRGHSVVEGVGHWGGSADRPGHPVVGDEPVTVEMDQIRSFDTWTKQGGVVSELYDRTVSPDLDSIQGRVRGERVTRERPLRRVHNDLVPFPDQIPGEAEDMGLRSSFFGSEVPHDLMDLHT